MITSFAMRDLVPVRPIRFCTAQRVLKKEVI